MPPFDVLVRLPAVLRLPGMELAAVRKDLVYKTIGQQELRFDLSRPWDAAPEARLPLVVLVHGGPIPEGASAKNMGIFQSLGRLLAASGLAAVAFSHRFHKASMLLEAAGDLRDVLRHLQAGAAEYGLDADRVALWAFSGGGPFLSSALRDAPPYVKALVAYYAVLDLRERPPGAAAGGPEDLTDDTREAFSPAYHVGKRGRSAPPILVARAGADNPWLNAGIDRFVARALEANAEIEVLNHPDGRHGFDLLDDVPRSHEILRRTLDFLRARLLG
jgi:acetyl esterase/lipase